MSGNYFAVSHYLDRIVARRRYPDAFGRRGIGRQGPNRLPINAEIGIRRQAVDSDIESDIGQ